MPHRLYQQVAERAGFRCEYCQAPERISPDRFEVEHIVPRAFGGSDELSNLALACSYCNRRKAQATQGLDIETLRTAALFNPREDAWDTHFRIRDTGGDPGEIHIDGLTATGRATVARLRMNDGRIVNARLLWSLVGLF